VALSADAIVVGGGIAGLTVATAAARRGKSVIIVSETRRGEASRAAAGMLAPSVEQSSGPARDFAIAARDFFPSYLEGLADSTGIRVPLNRLGILQVALSERGMRGLRKTAFPMSTWLDRTELNELEPALGHALGAVYNPDDGAVDNTILMSALSTEADDAPLISQIAGSAVSVNSDGALAAVKLASGETLHAEDVVLAPGAWGGSIEGAGRLAAVRPCRGQLIAFQSLRLRHVTYGPRGYLVPRSSGTVIAGSTMEDVGFDSDTSAEGLAGVRSAAEEIAPGLAIAPVTAEWAGLRPVTPDMLPVVGRDPEIPNILYSCGHSRNGILLAPLTGEIIGSMLTGEPLAYDLSRFRAGRF
jgi:glycine oxidase